MTVRVRKSQQETSQPEVAGNEIKKSYFFKEQLYVSARYADKKDLVAALLEDGRGYAIEEVDNIIAEYLHGKVR